MISDKDGSLSLSRTTMIATSAVVLFKMIVSDTTMFGVVFGAADLAGMALIQAAASAQYYANEKNKREHNV